MILTSTGNGRPTAAGLAAVLAILVIGFAGCGSSGSNELIVSNELSDPAPTPTLQAATPEGIAPTPEPAVRPEDTPTEAPNVTGLEWIEVDLSGVFDLDVDESLELESVGDGRVLATVARPDVTKGAFVSDNGVDWAALPIPASFSHWSADISGDRWLIQGWDVNSQAPGAQILFSDDEGASWTELVIELGPLGGTAWIVGAIVAEKRILVTALSDEVLDEDVGYEPSEARVHLFLSDGGPAELVAEFPGWASGGYGASDGFHLLIYGPDGDQLLYSPDGLQWDSTTIEVEITDSARNEVWTADPTDGQFKVERFEGVYGSDQVLTLPDGISWIADLAVGPAGVAAVGGPALPYDGSGEDFTLPDISIEKDGFELRYNQPEGGLTLWDLNENTAVFVFDAEAVQSETPPEGVREIEDNGGLMVVFDDPETEAELVAFSEEEISAAFMEEESAAQSAYDPYDFSVGWSLEGTDWEWQTLEEAFGLDESTQDDNSFIEVQVAVGHDFVLAKVQTFVFPEADLYEDAEIGVGEGQPSALHTAPNSLASPARWFIARVG